MGLFDDLQQEQKKQNELVRSSQKVEPERTPERPNGRTGEQVNARTSERANRRTPERVIERHSFNIYLDQYEALQQMEIDALKEGKRFNKSQFVREAIAKKLKK